MSLDKSESLNNAGNDRKSPPGAKEEPSQASSAWGTENSKASNSLQHKTTTNPPFHAPRGAHMDPRPASAGPEVRKQHVAGKSGYNLNGTYRPHYGYPSRGPEGGGMSQPMQPYPAAYPFAPNMYAHPPPAAQTSAQPLFVKPKKASVFFTLAKDESKEEEVKEEEVKVDEEVKEEEVKVDEEVERKKKEEEEERKKKEEEEKRRKEEEKKEEERKKEEEAKKASVQKPKADAKFSYTFEELLGIRNSPAASGTPPELDKHELHRSEGDTDKSNYRDRRKNKPTARDNRKKGRKGPAVPRQAIDPTKWQPNMVVQNKDEHEKMLSQVIGIMNRVSGANMDTLSKDLFGVFREKLSGFDDVFEVAKIISKRAINEINFAAIYATLTQKIVENEVGTVKYAVPTALVGEKESETSWNFREILIFHINTVYAKRGDTVDPEKVAAMDAGALAEHRTRCRNRLIGVMVYIGELFNHNVIKGKIISQLIFELIESPAEGDEREENVEALCRLLATVGRKFDVREPARIQFLKSLKAHISNFSASVSARSKFMLMDIQELWQSGWDPDYKAKEQERLNRGRRVAGRKAVKKRPEEFRRSGRGDGRKLRREMRAEERVRDSYRGKGSGDRVRLTEDSEVRRESALTESTDVLGASEDRTGASEASEEDVLVDEVEEEEEEEVGLGRIDLPRLTDKQEEDARVTIEELFDTYDAEEAYECIGEIGAQEAHNDVVRIITSMIFEAKPKQRDLLMELLGLLVEGGVLTRDQFVEGVRPSLSSFYDIMLDTPSAPLILARLLAWGIRNHLYELALVDSSLGPLVGKRKHPAEVIVGSILQDLRAHAFCDPEAERLASFEGFVKIACDDRRKQDIYSEWRTTYQLDGPAASEEDQEE